MWRVRWSRENAQPRGGLGTTDAIPRQARKGSVYAAPNELAQVSVAPPLEKAGPGTLALGRPAETGQEGRDRFH